LAVRAVKDEHQGLNGLLFNWQLRCPSFELTESTTQLGQWSPQSRTLSLSRQLLDKGWGALLEVLKHEMAHQYVDEVLGETEQSAHGPAFRRVCRERGIDARASGAPEASQQGASSGREQATLEKIARLLTLAESPNEHEAQAAMAAAQRLMLKHNLDECAHAASRNYIFRHVGAPTGRVFEAARILALILSEHFFVETIWVPVWRPTEGKRGSVIEVCGSWANVEMAAYAHDFLIQTSERLWREHKAASGIKSNRDRRSFTAGVMTGFREKLAREKSQNQRHGLVWRGDPQLSSYLKQRHPRSRWTHYQSSHNQAAHADGQRAGSKIVLHRGVTSGPSNRRRLLTS
jgi:hypothetical protein